MAWYSPSWSYRIKITIASSQVDADLTDFPVYVDLSDMPAAFFSNVKSDGGDIRVTKSDGTTEVAREIVFITTGSSIGEMHFQAAGTLSSSSDTDFYIYYGNSGASEPAASATYGSQNTWNSNYVAVWHNQEDPSGTAPQILDSTSNGHDMTSAGSMTSGDSVAGKLAGNALDFDGTDDYLTTPDTAALDTVGSQTISAWINTTNTITGRPILSKLASGAGTNGGWAFNSNSTANSIQYLTYNGTSATTSAIGVTAVNTGSWFLIHGAQDGATRADLYINGSNDASDTSTSAITAGSHLVNQASRGNTGTKIAAKIDEARVMSTNMTSTWISTEYNNQSSPGTFYSVGTQEENVTFTPRTTMVL